MERLRALLVTVQFSLERAGDERPPVEELARILGMIISEMDTGRAVIDALLNEALDCVRGKPPAPDGPTPTGALH